MERCTICGEPFEETGPCTICLLSMGLDDAAGMPEYIGRYRVIGLLGEGGMGTVYEAEQELPRRTVALKIIRAGAVNAQIAHRFASEAQALARLQHPGIAQVYEAGTADQGYGPQPYLAMELIQGRPLDQYAESHRLDTRDRLQLIIQVCESVQHAHERGIVHRDLKPGNILVEESGRPKILDFGVARITDAETDATGHTAVGQLVGTLAYMSPEQLLGDSSEIDARSDVYALGLILYQLLAGRLPYAVPRNVPQAVQAIRNQEPQPLSAISRKYRGDLSTIAGKALVKEKAARYASAAELAADLRCYMEHKPIAARPPSVGYQLRKFARRHSALVAGVAGIFLALIAGIIVSGREAAHARLAEHTALAAKQSADRERDRALVAEKQALAAQQQAEAAGRKAADSEARARRDRDQALREKQRANAETATAEAINDFLQHDLLAQASNSEQAGPGVRLDPDLKIRTALDRAAARIDGKFDHQPLVEASIRQTIGSAYEDLGVFAEAQRQVEAELQILVRVLGADDPRTLSARQQLGMLYQSEKQYPQSEAILTGVLAAQRRKLGSLHPQTLSTMTMLGKTYWFEEKWALDEPLLTEALTGQRETLGPEHPDTLESMRALANLYARTLRYAQAEELLPKVIEISRRVHGPEHPFTVGSMNILANRYSLGGKFAEAEQAYFAVQAIQKRVRGEDHPNVLNTMTSLALLYWRQEKYGQARPILAKLVELAPGALGLEDVISRWSLTHLAELERKEKRYAESEALWLRVLESRRFGPRPDTQALAALGHVRIEQKKFAEAESVIREALAADEKAAPGSWALSRDQVLLGAALAGQSKYSDAEPLLRSGLEGLRQRQSGIPADQGLYLDFAASWARLAVTKTPDPPK